MVYTEQKFNLPDLKGLSAKQLEAHLGLYAGYVKHVNLVREKIRELESEDKEKHAYTIAELRRRFSFEFDGMRMHEYYFEQWEDGAISPSTGSTGSTGSASSLQASSPQASSGSSALVQALTKKYKSWDGFIEHFKTVGMTRGIGWAVLYFDPKGKTPHVTWVGDHELGTLAGLPIILAMDMWEHAYMVDYLPSEKKEYINAFLNNLNWNVIGERFTKAH